MQETPRKFLLLIIFFLLFSTSSQNPQEEEEEEEGTYYCGDTPIPNPSNLLTCRSGDLYFKNSTGLFHVSGAGELKFRARVSMEVEGHMPDFCIGCQRPDGNCGAAVRCICHPKECKNKVENKVINFGTKSRALSGNTQQLLPPVFLALFLF